MSTLQVAAPAPRGLLYLATFNAAERAAIAASPELRQAIRDTEPAEWPAIVERHQVAQRQAVATTRPIRHRAEGDGAERQQHRYAAAILDRELCALASMQRGSGRNHAAFKLACRVGRWVHHGVIRSDDFTAAVLDACEHNGLVAEDGRAAVLATVASGLARAAHDTLPVLEGR
jgi:hypothetical protein